PPSVTRRASPDRTPARHRAQAIGRSSSTATASIWSECRSNLERGEDRTRAGRAGSALARQSPERIASLLKLGNLRVQRSHAFLREVAHPRAIVARVQLQQFADLFQRE